jgi:peptidoglycan hydrolase-like protein with peptidoglycan-binding domain
MKVIRTLLSAAFAVTLTAAVAHAQTAAANPSKKDSTHAAMSSMSRNRPSDSAHAATTTQWTKQQIMEAQTGLKKAGYFKGTPNGVWTHETTTALRQYQHANHLAVTGKLTDDELNKLKGSGG